MGDGRLEFKIELQDEAGQLALVSREFANHGINIETMCAIDTNVVIVTDQTTEARMALNSLPALRLGSTLAACTSSTTHPSPVGAAASCCLAD